MLPKDSAAESVIVDGSRCGKGEEVVGEWHTTLEPNEGICDVGCEGSIRMGEGGERRTSSQVREEGWVKVEVEGAQTSVTS